MNILVFGDDGINTLGIIRSLGEKRLMPDVVLTTDSTSAMVSKSKYVNEVYYSNKNEIVSFLLEFKEKKAGPIYLIPTSDFALSILSKYEKSLTDRFVFPCISYNNNSLFDMMNKSVMALAAREAGFSVPKYLRCEIKNGIIYDEKSLTIFHSADFPLLIKSDNIDDANCGYTIVRNNSDLKNELRKMEDAIVIVQTYIENAEEIAIQGVGFGKESPVIPGYIRKLRTSLLKLGTTTYAELERIDDNKLYSIVEEFIKKISLYGIFDIDVLLANNQYFFIECNFRNGSNGYAYTRYGVNLPWVWINAVANNQYDRKSNFKKITFMSEFSDFRHVIRHNISLINWMIQFVRVNAHLVFNLHDQGPFWFEIKRILKRGN